MSATSFDEILSHSRNSSSPTTTGGGLSASNGSNGNSNSTSGPRQVTLTLSRAVSDSSGLSDFLQQLEISPSSVQIPPVTNGDAAAAGDAETKEDDDGTTATGAVSQEVTLMFESKEEAVKGMCHVSTVLGIKPAVKLLVFISSH